MGTTGGSAMRRFWDARAREDAYYFINNTLDYGDPDLDRFWESGPEDVDKILRLLGVGLSPADTVVEIGCGVGRMSRAIAARVATVRAVDVSPEMIERARDLNRSLDNVDWIVGDGGSLAGVDAGEADAVLSFVVFQHIPDPEVTLAYVREMGRVLRPGGWAGFQVSDEPSVHARRSLSRRLRDRVAAARGRLPHGWSHPAWRGSPTDLRRLRQTAGEAGLATERVEGRGTQFCFVLLRKSGPQV
ncbi:MAG TPA: class I SAM-dependent methyltransferase [Solirubrobacterales bacterium]